MKTKMATDTRKVLVVDDEPEVREMLELNLTVRGFEARTARDGVEALATIKDWQPDAIILDVVMPKIDGISLLPMIRRLTEAPIIMLTARSELGDVVRGLESGADGYIAKPFEMTELIARLNAKLRRPVLEHRSTLTCADLTIDLQTFRAVRGEQHINLTAREFSVLATMLRHPGQVFTRDQIFDAVWGADSDAERGIVDRTISNVRAKVDQGHEIKLIQTIRGVGFSLRE